MTAALVAELVRLSHDDPDQWPLIQCPADVVPPIPVCDALRRRLVVRGDDGYLHPASIERFPSPLSTRTPSGVPAITSGGESLTPTKEHP